MVINRVAEIYLYNQSKRGGMGNLLSRRSSSSSSYGGAIASPPRLTAAAVNSVDNLNFSMELLLNSLDDDDDDDEVKGEMFDDARYAEQLCLQEALVMGNLLSRRSSSSSSSSSYGGAIASPPRLPAAAVNSVDDLNFSMELLLNSLDDDDDDEEVKGEIFDDARYAEQMCLQEALLMSAETAANSHMVASAVNYGSSKNNIEGNRNNSTSFKSSQVPPGEEAAGPSGGRVRGGDEKNSTSSKSRQLPHLKDVPREEAAGTSRGRVEGGDGSSHQNFCGICMEAGKRSKEMFKNPKCPHTFCSACISHHIIAKIQNNYIIVTCPELNCKVTLEPHICKGIIPEQVFDRWGNALCESTILGSQKLYCPFTDCSGPLENDGGGAAGPAGVLMTIRETECLHCRRLFCAQCKVPWHSGIQCEDFQKLNKDERGGTDLMLRSLAKKENWRRCPNCKFYVDKRDGCLHITCRCKYEFCYRCGERWAEGHGGCR